MMANTLKCPVCNSNVYHSLKNEVHPDDFSDDVYNIQLEGYLKTQKNCSKISFNIAICPYCQLLFKETFFSDNELEEIYQHEYLSQEAKMVNLEGFVYSNAFFLGNCSKDAFDLVTKINCTRSSQIKRIFDIGGRNGFRLMELARNNFECIVFDPIPLEPCDNTIKKEYLFLDDIDAKKNSADLIIFCNILEHCKNPVDVISKCSNLLNDYGYIFIQVPFEIPLILEWLLIGKIRKKNLRNDLTHVLFFTLESLTTLLESKGFTCIDANIESLQITESGSQVLVINVLAQKTNMVKKPTQKMLKLFNTLNTTVIKFELNRLRFLLNKYFKRTFIVALHT